MYFKKIIKCDCGHYIGRFENLIKDTAFRKDAVKCGKCKEIFALKEFVKSGGYFVSGASNTSVATKNNEFVEIN